MRARPLSRAVRALLPLICAAACRGAPPSKTDWGAGATDDTGAEAGPSTARIASFNAEWLADHYTTSATEREDFQPRLEADYAMIRSLIVDNEIDVLGLQEVEGEGAIELLGLPSTWSWAVGDTGWSQNLVIAWRNDRFSLDKLRAIPLDANSGAARDPLVAELRHRDGALGFTLVVVHNNPYEDAAEARMRRAQVEELAQWVEATLPDEESSDLADQRIILGDFNDSFEGINPSVPSLEALEGVAGLRFASRQTSGVSYIPYASLIDHVALSPPLADRWTGADDPEGFGILLHDQTEPWSSYTDGYRGVPNISDHRPVFVDLRLEAG
jgi:endonuclease/exonuclease/phosphatase family metal-dependent hydrolase